MRKLFISTGSFNTSSLETTLQLCYKNNIKNVELSSNLDWCENVENLIDIYRQKFGFEFLIHNYFPPPKEEFVLNLSSTNRTIVNKSISLCENAINICAINKIPFYSLHCGFTFKAGIKHLGSSQQQSASRISKRVALDNFIKNLAVVIKMAKEKCIKIAIENNVVASFSYRNNQNDLFLGVTKEDIQYIFSRFKYHDIYLLLDLGHAKVNSHVMDISLSSLTRYFYKKILAVHISDNDGQTDANKIITAESDLIPYISQLKNKYLILEVYNLNIADLIKQYKYIKTLTR